MIHHQPLSGAWARNLAPTLRIGTLAMAAFLASCGGNNDPVPLNADDYFQLLAGGAACGGGGCGGDSGDGGGVGSGDGGGDGAGGGLGQMRNVKVTARKPDGTVLGSAMLQNNLVSVYDRQYKGAFILEFADDGSGNAEYYDEASESWTKLNGQALHIIVPLLKHHVSANPLTEAAYQWALNKYGTESALTAARMTEANEVVRQAFNLRVPTGYQVSDITNYAVAVSDATVANSLPNSHAGRFGTLLAAMPRAARLFLGTLPSPALAFMRQLVKDIRDDGTVNATIEDAEPQAYDSSLPEMLADAIVSARASYGVAAQPAPNAVPSVCFNPALFTIGTKWQLNYNDVVLRTAQQPLGSAGGSSQLSLEVTRTTSFQKYPTALEVKLFDGTDTIYTYTGTDISQGLVNYGSSFTTSAQGPTLTFVNLIDPPTLNRQFLLKQGESDVVSLTSTQTIYNPDGSVFQQGTPVTLTQTTTFVGYEDVTVPAGVFKSACHYQVVDVNGTTDTWYTSAGQGVPVLTVGGGTRSELVSGTVNGQPVK